MWRRYQKAFIYVVIFLIPLWIFFLRPKNIRPVFLMETALVPANALQSIVKEFQKLWFYRETYDAYVSMKKRYDVLMAKYIALEAGIDTLERQQALQDYKKRSQLPMMQASVIGRDPSHWDAAIIVNRGQQHGIKVGMPVITEVGVVGRIIEVGKTTSKVMMLADANFALAAMTERSRESGLLTGSLQGIARLQYLTDKADVKIGDYVVTSTLSTAFPPELLIGRIVDLRASTVSHSVDCLVEPAVNLSQLENVLIIKSNP